MYVGTVAAVVPGGTYLDVTLGGGTPVRIPRLDGYNAQVGDIAYVIATESLMVAIGTVK